MARAGKSADVPVLSCGYRMAATQCAEKVTNKTTAVTSRELARRKLDALKRQRDALVFSRTEGLPGFSVRQQLINASIYPVC